jgi:hypothetical protein
VFLNLSKLVPYSGMELLQQVLFFYLSFLSVLFFASGKPPRVDHTKTHTKKETHKHAHAHTQ